MKILQRDYNLDSYKLDNVSAGFIQGPVKSIEVNGGKTKIKTKNT